MSQDTGKFRTNTKDQFFTHVDVAQQCIDVLDKKIRAASTYLWVEPSAGNGAFLHRIPEGYARTGLDIDPKSHDIIRQDFMTWHPPSSSKIILFGNPPFGRQSCLAKSFIRKGCSFAHVIAFILPRSFIKPSMNNVFDTKFHLVYSKELPKNAFVINDTKHDVPCVFQIWKKMKKDRIIEKAVKPVGFTYVKADESYDIALRRVGGLAGKCYAHTEAPFSTQSHYFIKCHGDTNDIIKKINGHTFPSNTVGPRSLSKSEVNTVLNSFFS